MTREELKNKLQEYIDMFDSFCNEQKISTENINIDHVCYKCGSTEEFENIRKTLEFEEKFMYQSIISKRRIAYIGFSEPLNSIFGKVYYLELSDQKPDNSQKSKCDHLEPIPNGISYESMVERFRNSNLEIVETIKPHHSTHDSILPNGVKVKMSSEKLIDKIHREEM